MPLSPEQIAARKAAITGAAIEREEERSTVRDERMKGFRYVKPLSKAAESVLEALVNSDERFRFGLPEIDVLTRGCGPKELVMLTGFSHAGKTQLVNTAIVNNPEKRILFFSMDDAAEMILLKLACMKAGISAEELERRVRNGDDEATLLVRQAASRTFENLIVVDEALSVAKMDDAIEEATEYWGSPPDAVVIDYLSSIVGSTDEEGAEDVRSKAKVLKRWVKKKDWPTIVVHQQSRSHGGPGKPVTITSGSMGGEEFATILIGVRRKRDDQDIDEHERRQHTNTITVHVVKNKRPPARHSPYDGLDFYMSPETGLIKSLTPAQMQHQRAQDRERGSDDEALRDVH